MIKLQNVEKYYNKSKQNELHVINNCNIELPDTGLISFIGKSGSGKTTLLNVIGGLDKNDSGSIIYDETTFKKYKMNKIDSYRREHIGYIFQNYLLLENLSVYDNLRIMLETINIFDKEEQQKRIEYVLKAVGMFKYRKKHADKLSGGQQQRVSIARALLKPCKVIIADEPTGNLDTANTIEVMNVLKKISKKTLVLLVTHNKDIAEFYSDRIIDIVDGQIASDNINIKEQQSLNVINDRNIYLKDLNQEEIMQESLKFNVYSEDSNPPIELTIVYKNNTLYIDSPINIQLVKQTNTKLINDHYKELKIEEVDDFDFDISWYNNQKKNSWGTLFFRNFKRSIKEFFTRSIRSTVFHGIFFIIGIIMGFCTIFTLRYSKTNDSYYSTENAIYLNDNSYDIDYYYYPYVENTSIYQAIDNGLIEDVYYYNGFYYDIEYKYNTVRNETLQIRQFDYPFNMVSDKKLICGVAPYNDHIVIGKGLADFIMKNMDIVTSYDDILGIVINDVTICGISSVNTNSCYYNMSDYYKPKGYYKEESNIGHYKFEDYTVILGEDIVSNDQLLLESIYQDLFNIGDFITDKGTGKTYEVVGFFETDGYCSVIAGDKSLLACYFNDISIYWVNNYLSFLSSKNTSYELVNDGLSRLPQNKNEVLANYYSCYEIGDEVADYKIVGFYNSDEIGKGNYILLDHTEWLKNVVVSGNGRLSFKIKDGAENEFNSMGISCYTPYEYEYQVDIKCNADSRIVSLSILVFLLVISIIYIYFTTRSKLINQVKEVGIYRSIGSSKRQIYHKYISNIFVETTLTSIIGYLLCVSGYSIILSLINNLINGPKTTIYYGYYILGVICLYVINFVFGMVPVYLLLRKTPSEINSKYDI
ncbi:MAG: ATP-binding cassette domain-containing protein [Anaeroplasma sp.]